jgi:hypothetical protein
MSSKIAAAQHAQLSSRRQFSNERTLNRVYSAAVGAPFVHHPRNKTNNTAADRSIDDQNPGHQL